MTREHHTKASDSGHYPVPSDLTTMHSESAYRELEQDCRSSDQYAWMQQRYPQLRFWIAHCDPSDLVGISVPHTPLQWERSHGED